MPEATDEELVLVKSKGVWNPTSNIKAKYQIKAFFLLFLTSLFIFFYSLSYKIKGAVTGKSPFSYLLTI